MDKDLSIQKSVWLCNLRDILYDLGALIQGGRITLESPSCKYDMLRLAPQLRHSTGYINIYITPDLTRKKRETNNKLRNELNSRRAGETNLTIRSGRIMRLPAAQSSASVPRPLRQHLAVQKLNQLWSRVQGWLSLLSLNWNDSRFLKTVFCVFCYSA